MKLLPPCRPRLFPSLIIISIFTGLPWIGLSQTSQFDTDANGLDDPWEIKFFGAIGQDPDDDPDGDGHDNLAECLAFTDPNNNRSCLELVDSVFKPTSASLSFPTVQGKNYYVEVSTDIENWSAIEAIAGTPLAFHGSGGNLELNFATPDSPRVHGACSRAVWLNEVPPYPLDDLKTHFNSLGDADGTEWRSSLKGPSDYGDNYAARYSGYIIPRRSGNYTFRVASRGDCALYLQSISIPPVIGTFENADAKSQTSDESSATSSLTHIATDPFPVGGMNLIAELRDDGLEVEENWNYLSDQGLPDTQTSSPINLTAGVAYAFELYHVAADGFDHVAASWDGPGTREIEIIAGSALRPAESLGSSNAANLLSVPQRNFVRVVTHGGTSSMALDSDGDGVDDASEEELRSFGFNPFAANSTGHATGNDTDSLTDMLAFDPATDLDEVSTFAYDPESIELIDPPLLPGPSLIVDITQLGSQTGTSGNKIRFRLRRKNGLYPLSVFYTLGGGTAPEMDATPYIDYDATDSDDSGQTADGVVLIPALRRSAEIEITANIDQVHEYPETVSCTVDPHTSYIVETGAELAKSEIIDMPPEVNLLFIGAYEEDFNQANPTSANGTVAGYLKGDKRSFIMRNDNFENLSSPQNDTHFHKIQLSGQTEVGGPPIHDILDTGGEVILGHYLTYDWHLTEQNPVTSSVTGQASRQVVIDSLFGQGGETKLYINLHTDDNAGGEIMAKLVPGTGSTTPPDPPADPPTIGDPDFPLLTGNALEAEIVRFLSQATFGADPDEVASIKANIENERLNGNSDYNRIEEFTKWIDAQLLTPQTFLVDYTLAADNLEWNLRGAFDPSEWNDWIAPSDGTPDAAPLPAAWPSINRSLTLGPAPGMPNTNPHFYGNQWYPENNYPLGTDWISWLNDESVGEGEKVVRSLGENNQDNRRRAHWAMMVNAKDQLRQKWGYAIQQILVVSETLTRIRTHHIAAANYQDMLNYYGMPGDRDGSGVIESDEQTYFRDLIGYVNWSPIMGKWLSSLKNQEAFDITVPPDGINDVFPDENLAREDMQLFTIGLFLLWLDGSLQLEPGEDSNTPPGSVATYGNDEIQEFARILTGQSFSRFTNNSLDANGFRQGQKTWGIDGTDTGEVFDTDNSNGDAETDDGDDGILYNTNFNTGEGNKYINHQFTYPMRMFGSFHDNTGPKTIAGGRVIDNPIGTEDERGIADIEDALNWFAGKVDGNAAPDFTGDAQDPNSSHPSTPAFISRKLIQRMVTSNPPSDYIFRVSNTFKNTEGSMADILKAILLDYHARAYEEDDAIFSPSESDTYGMKKSPLEGYMQLLRTFKAHSLLPLVDDPSRPPFNGSYPTVDGGYNPGQYSGQGQYHRIFLNEYSYPSSQSNNFANNCYFQYNNTDGPLTMSPLAQETVFNFYLPDYTPGGVIQEAQLVAPEMQIATETNVVRNINYFWTITWRWDGNRDRRDDGQAVNQLGDSTRNQQEAFNGGVQGAGDWDYHENIRIDLQEWADSLYPSDNLPDPDGSGPLTSENAEDEALVDIIDRYLIGGHFKIRYPLDPSDDEDPARDGTIIGDPATPISPREANALDGDFNNDLEFRNPREWVIHTLSDSFGDATNNASNRLNKFRSALYLLTTTPEYMVKK